MVKSTNTRIILGIDPGIADTGYGIIKITNGNLINLAFGSIKTSKDDSLPNRILSLDKEIQKIIETYSPDIVSIEKLFFCNNSKTAFIVGQARGVILLAAARNNLPIREYTPLQVKVAVCGYGKAGKGQIQQSVKIILKMKEIAKPDDAADALAVAICSATNYDY